MQIPGTSLRIHLPTGEEFGGEWIRVYVWLGPFTVHLKTVTIVLICYTPTQNKKAKILQTLCLQCKGCELKPWLGN